MLYDEELTFGYPLAPIGLDYWRIIAPHLVSTDLLNGSNTGISHFIPFNNIHILAMPLNFPLSSHESSILTWLINGYYNCVSKNLPSLPFKILNFQTSCFNLPLNPELLEKFFLSLDPSSPSISEIDGSLNKNVFIFSVTWLNNDAEIFKCDIIYFFFNHFSFSNFLSRSLNQILLKDIHEDIPLSLKNQTLANYIYHVKSLKYPVTSIVSYTKGAPRESHHEVSKQAPPKLHPINLLSRIIDSIVQF